MNNVNQRVTSLNVLQEFMSTIGEEESVNKNGLCDGQKNFSEKWNISV